MVNPHGETYGICKNKCLVEVSPKEDVVHKSGDETIPGNKTFTGNVTFGTSGSPRQVSLKGDLVIDGNISQSGANYETHAEEVYTKQDKIILRDGAVSGLGVNERTGFTFKKYDGANDGNLVVGADGTAYVGDTGDLQPILTRAPVNSMVAGKPIVWDSAGARAVTTNAIDEALALKADKTEVAGHTGRTDNPHGVTKAQVGLGSYPTSPADIGISTATQTALNGKADTTALTGHTNNKSNPHSVTKAQVGLGNVDNTSDANKPISTAVQAALDALGDIGAAEVATTEEAIAGVNDTKMMTPLKVQQAIFHFIAQPPTPADIAPYLPPVNCTALLTMYQNNTSITETPTINAKNCTSLKEVFFRCSNLVTVGYIHCPNVTNMAAMFQLCSSLTTIPSLDISSVTTMRYIFSGCSSLTSVTFQCNNVRPYGTDMFYNTPIASGNGRIYVPDNLVQAYKTASGWSTHASVIFGHSDKANM